MSLDYEQIKQEVKEELMQSLSARFNHEKERKLTNYRQQNAYVQKGRTLFTGSSLMEYFPITEYCLNEGLPIVYNRGIGGYTTDEFLAAIEPCCWTCGRQSYSSTSVPTICVPFRMAQTGLPILPAIIAGSAKSSGTSCRTPSFI